MSLSVKKKKELYVNKIYIGYSKVYKRTIRNNKKSMNLRENIIRLIQHKFILTKMSMRINGRTNDLYREED